LFYSYVRKKIKVNISFTPKKYDLKDDISESNIKWIFEEWESLEDLRSHAKAQMESNSPSPEEMAEIIAPPGTKFVIAKF